MTVTFCAEVGEPVAFVLTCGCAAVTETATRHSTYDAALEQFTTLRDAAADGPITMPAGCRHPERCSVLGPLPRPLFAEEGPELSLTAGNALYMLAMLGYGTPGEASEPCGAADAGEFLDRVTATLPALAAPSRRGSAAAALDGDPSYVLALLDHLRELATWCRDRGRRLQWA